MGFILDGLDTEAYDRNHSDKELRHQRGFTAGLRRGLTLNSIIPIMGASSGLGVGLLIYAGGMVSHNGLITPGEGRALCGAVQHLFSSPVVRGY